ncbi:methyl-accepting chemotaxis protein [Paramagnetospirillum kuznetsovii]|nr:HAMP domain-containing methyl-accepting chemotaxis protein [Paramagnetospirillum kuznetsovii]
MGSTVSGLFTIFLRGLGLRISLSFLPPIALAWAFFVLYLTELSARKPDSLGWAVALGLVGIAIGSVVVFWLILTTIPPIRHVIDVTATLARGELGVDIPYRERKDETGELARALDVFKRHVVELSGVAALKAEKEDDISKKRELLSLADALEGEVEGTIKQVMVQAEAMTRSTGEAAQAIRRMEGLYQTLTAASSETQVNVNAVAAATDELASASREIASQMARTIAITRDAVAKADEADATMRQLAEVSTSIVEVLQMIDAIAGQTNLLALNATIEAARAGDAGKGFAVVASEVKTLAGQTAKAVSTIAEQVQSIRSATENGVNAIEAVGRTIDEVNNVATAVAAAVEEQEASTREISSNAQNAAQQAQRVSQDAASISSEVANVDALASLVESGATEVSKHLGTMETRLSGILVHTVGSNQQGAGHAGKPLAGAVRRAGRDEPCRFEDMEVETARLVGPAAEVGTELELTVEEFGALKARVVEVRADGAVVEFILDSTTKARLGEFLFGHQAVDQFFIKLAKTNARKVEQAFEAELAKGTVTMEDLFDRDYQPIANTNPQQFTTRFLDMADRVLPPIQEEIIKADPKVVFGLAINMDGYVSAHQVHSSKPQGPDPIWNAANCRNRRIFNNRAELNGVTHTKEHLLQTYIRDMGGGRVVLLKDASVPITVRGRHWGGLRLGYQL